MLNKLFTALFFVFCAAGIIYLALPNCDLPESLPDSIVSQEPADLETPSRRGYFTNNTRDEVLAWYGKEFSCVKFFGMKIPKILLNYPPEYAQTIIRDRTDIGWLQEYVYPLREGIYINGFAPIGKDGQAILSVEGQLWRQKIIIKHVQGSIWLREIVFIASALGIALLYRGFVKLFSNRAE